MVVDVDELLNMLEYMEAINKTPLEQITWIKKAEFHGGWGHARKVIEVSSDVIKEFKFIGLSNVSFVELAIIGKGHKVDRLYADGSATFVSGEGAESEAACV